MAHTGASCETCPVGGDQKPCQHPGTSQGTSPLSERTRDSPPLGSRPLALSPSSTGTGLQSGLGEGGGTLGTGHRGDEARPGRHGRDRGCGKQNPHACLCSPGRLSPERSGGGRGQPSGRGGRHPRGGCRAPEAQKSSRLRAERSEGTREPDPAGACFVPRPSAGAASGRPRGGCGERCPDWKQLWAFDFWRGRESGGLAV